MFIGLYFPSSFVAAIYVRFWTGRVWGHQSDADGHQAKRQRVESQKQAVRWRHVDPVVHPWWLVGNISVECQHSLKLHGDSANGKADPVDQTVYHQFVWRVSFPPSTCFSIIKTFGRAEAISAMSLMGVAPVFTVYADSTKRSSELESNSRLFAS